MHLISDYIVGDKVDMLMNDLWWEGSVVETSPAQDFVKVTATCAEDSAASAPAPCRCSGAQTKSCLCDD